MDMQHHPEPQQSRNQKIQNILLLSLSIVLVLFLLEMTLRAVYPQKLYNICMEKEHPQGPGGEMRLHSSFGWYPKENYKACRYQPDTNRIIYLTHNSKGLRTLREIPYEKPAGKKRVLILGDSFVHHEYLDDSDTLAVHLEEQLPAQYEVVPLAASGWGTDQELIALFEEGLKYQPDLILLFFYQNDFSNVLYLAQTYADKPTFTLDANKSLKLHNYPTQGTRMNNFSITKSLQMQQPLRALLLKYSHLYSLWFHKKGNLIKAVVPPEKQELTEEGTDGEIWSIKRKYFPKMNYGANLVFFLFDRFKLAAEKGGAEFVVINVPSRFNVQKKAQEKLISTYENISKRDFEFTKVSRIFRETLPEKNISYIDLISVASEHPDKFYFKTDGHWTSFAVQRSSAYIARELKRKSLIEK